MIKLTCHSYCSGCFQRLIKYVFIHPSCSFLIVSATLLNPKLTGHRNAVLTPFPFQQSHHALMLQQMQDTPNETKNGPFQPLIVFTALHLLAAPGFLRLMLQHVELSAPVRHVERRLVPLVTGPGILQEIALKTLLCKRPLL